VSAGVLKLGFKVDASGALKGLRKRSEAHRKAFDRAFTREVLAVFEDTQRDVPRRTGSLADTGKVEFDKDDSRRLRIWITYGAPYALWVHERNLNYRHGKWKYVDDPVRKWSKGLGRRLAAAVRSAVGST
jgi:hypothetical protein